MSLATWSSFDWVREARIRREGAWEAMARAVEEPIDSGLTPVIRTISSISIYVELELACTHHVSP
jgi:hypothetical protein